MLIFLSLVQIIHILNGVYFMYLPHIQRILSWASADDAARLHVCVIVLVDVSPKKQQRGCLSQTSTFANRRPKRSKYR